MNLTDPATEALSVTRFAITMTIRALTSGLRDPRTWDEITAAATLHDQTLPEAVADWVEAVADRTAATKDDPWGEAYDRSQAERGLT